VNGVRARLPDIPAIDHVKVMRYDEVLPGAKVPGRRIARPIGKRRGAV